MDNTLLILGNGFDLDLGFRTSYGAFMESQEFRNFQEATYLGKYIIRKTKCFRILERNAIISKTKRNFSRLYPTPQKIKKNRPASPERNTFEGS